MVQIIFTDGLGNQMFQYAFFLAMRERGRMVSINRGVADRSPVHNGFELCDAFQIDPSNLPIVMGGNFKGGFTIFALRYLNRLFCYKENVEEYSDAVFRTRKKIISGYWQNCRYFEHVSDLVRQSFRFRNIDVDNQTIGDGMKSCNSIAIHIRRGDYLKYPNYQVCTPDFYRKAITLIKEKVDSPVFFVFSDDLEWSEKFMENQGVCYKIINNNRGRDSYKDMYLMTCCHHNIIANSSFSWWGAWLNNHEDKIVVCPSKWNKSNSNIRPQLINWVKILV